MNDKLFQTEWDKDLSKFHKDVSRLQKKEVLSNKIDMKQKSMMISRPIQTSLITGAISGKN